MFCGDDAGVGRPALLDDITREYAITTVIISHDMKSAYDIGEHIVFLYKGRNFWEGNRGDIDTARKEIPELDAFIRSSQF